MPLHTPDLTQCDIYPSLIISLINSMELHTILFWHSGLPDNVSSWLCWSPDFSSGTIWLSAVFRPNQALGRSARAWCGSVGGYNWESIIVWSTNSAWIAPGLQLPAWKATTPERLFSGEYFCSPVAQSPCSTMSNLADLWMLKLFVSPWHWMWHVQQRWSTALVIR